MGSNQYTLGIERGLTSLVLRHLVKGVFFALASTKGFTSFGNIYLNKNDMVSMDGWMKGVWVIITIICCGSGPCQGCLVWS